MAAAKLPSPRTLPDAFSAAIERWIEEDIRGTPLDPYLLELREATPRLYARLVAELMGPPDEDEG